jgi:hypothetical protein
MICSTATALASYFILIHTRARDSVAFERHRHGLRVRPSQITIAIARTRGQDGNAAP